jgi:enoyl-[acyl-carrier-protein] reductase (NADH)
MMESETEQTPLGKLAEHQDVVNAVAFLASDVSGEIIGEPTSVA